MERKVTHEQLQELGQEIQRLVESKLQRSFEGPGVLGGVGAAAVAALIDYKDDIQNLRGREKQMVGLINECLAESDNG